MYIHVTTCTCTCMVANRHAFVCVHVHVHVHEYMYTVPIALYPELPSCTMYDLWVKCRSYVNILCGRRGGPGNEDTLCPSHMCIYVHVMTPGIGRNESCALGNFTSRPV